MERNGLSHARPIGSAPRGARGHAVRTGRASPIRRSKHAHYCRSEMYLGSAGGEDKIDLPASPRRAPGAAGHSGDGDGGGRHC